MKNFVSQNIAIHPIAKADGLSGDGIVKTMSVVIVTSVLTGIMTDLILKALLPEEQYMALHPDMKKDKPNRV
jgi:hypothetical protein